MGLAAVSFALAIAAFWVRPFVTFPKLRPFYEEFAGADVEQTRLVLCNIAASAFERNNREVSRKAMLMRWSLGILIGAIAVALIGFYLGGVS